MPVIHPVSQYLTEINECVHNFPQSNTTDYSAYTTIISIIITIIFIASFISIQIN